MLFLVAANHAIAQTSGSMTITNYNPDCSLDITLVAKTPMNSNYTCDLVSNPIHLDANGTGTYVFTSSNPWTFFTSVGWSSYASYVPAANWYDYSLYAYDFFWTDIKFDWTCDLPCSPSIITGNKMSVNGAGCFSASPNWSGPDCTSATSYFNSTGTALNDVTIDFN